MRTSDNYELVYIPEERSYELVDFAGVNEAGEGKKVAKISKALIVELILGASEGVLQRKKENG